MRRSEEKALIIGAGPAGLATASLLRRLDAIVFEEHREPGVPPHCTGLVGHGTMLFYKELAGPRVVEQRYNTITYHVYGEKPLTLRWEKPVAYRLKRPLLEQRLRDRAEKLGHRVETGTRIRRAWSRGVEDDGGRSYRGLVVDAEGALNRIAVAHGQERNRHIYGVQRIIGYDGEENHIHVFFTPLTPRFFAWLVPLGGGEALLGYAEEKPGLIDKAVVKHVSREMGIGEPRVKAMYGGLIPVNPPGRPVSRGVYFIGDSASMLKPFTGGGLYAISRLASPLAKALEEARPEIYIEAAEKLLAQLRREHRAVNMIRLIGYHRAMKLFTRLAENGLEVSAEDYDQHQRVATKALILLLKKPWILLLPRHRAGPANTPQDPSRET